MAESDDLEKFFIEADADGNGALTITELATTLRKYGYRGTDDQIKVNVIGLFRLYIRITPRGINY